MRKIAQNCRKLQKIANRNSPLPLLWSRPPSPSCLCLPVLPRLALTCCLSSSLRLYAHEPFGSLAPSMLGLPVPFSVPLLLFFGL